MSAKTAFKVGQKVTVIAAKSGHGLPIGSTATVSYKNGAYWVVTGETGAGYNVYESDIKAISGTKDDICKELEETNRKVAILQAKLDYLNETKQTELNETEFKAYGTLKIVNQKGISELNKAKAIAQLIEG